MIATLSNEPRKGMNPNHHKERHYYESYLGLAIVANDAGQPEIRNIAELRIYQTNATAYACIWVYSPTFYTRGSGQASGYGYHRASTATEYAIQAAGIELSEPISARGDSAIVDAIGAITKAACPNAIAIHVSNTHA